MLLYLLLAGLYRSVCSCNLRWQRIDKHGAATWEEQHADLGKFPERCRPRIYHSWRCRGRVRKVQQCYTAVLFSYIPLSGVKEWALNRNLRTRCAVSVSTRRHLSQDLTAAFPHTEREMQKISRAMQFSGIKWTQGLISYKKSFVLQETKNKEIPFLKSVIRKPGFELTSVFCLF